MRQFNILLSRSGKWLVAIAAVVIAFLVLRQAMHVPLDTLWPPHARCSDALCQEGREWLAMFVTGGVLLAGLFQYWRGQVWKRAEFLAEEMKTFLTAPRVQNALTMVDWARRNIDLHEQKGADQSKWPLVTRQIQISALIPHGAKGEVHSEKAEAQSELVSYSKDEVAIRDCFDAFLDGLERFASYRVNGLATTEDLRPYLGYWIDSIAAETDDDEEAMWAAMLFAYIDYYGYFGVQALFRAFGHNIRPGRKVFNTFAGGWPTGERLAVLKAVQDRAHDRGDTRTQDLLASFIKSRLAKKG